MMNIKVKKMALAIALSCTLSGCAYEEENQSVDLTTQYMSKESLASSLDLINQERSQSPDDLSLRARQQSLTDELVLRYLREAEQAVRVNDFARASEAWHSALLYQPGNTRARQGLSRIDSWRALEKNYQEAVDLSAKDPEQALQKIQRVLEEDPNWPQAIALRDHLYREMAVRNKTELKLNRELRKTISLNFRHHNLMSILDTISELTGVNIIYDKDVSPSATGSLIAQNTTAEDAINLLMLSHQLQKKVLNDNTLLIYPATPQKEKQYRDVIVKTVFLGYAKAKDINVALRNLVKLRDVHVDERTNSVTMRGPRESVEKAERLLVTLDRPEAEVTLAVEVLEVNSTEVEKLGINYPGQIGIGFNSTGTGSNIPLNGFNGSNMFINLGAGQGISADLQKVRSGANVLANPRIRVKNNKKAVIEIGQRIPVLTSTIKDGFSQEHVEYQDVGLKLEVTPEVSIDNNISMDVKFNLSTVGSAEKSKDGVSYYRTNNREAKTVLSSQSGETQMLAGLIKQDDKNDSNGIPFLSEIPGLGRIFGSKGTNKERTEVVLLITPMIDRSIDLPGAHINTIEMGTEESQGDASYQLRNTRPSSGNGRNFSAPPLAPSAQFPTKTGALPDPIGSQELANP